MKSDSDSLFHWFISYITFFDNGGIYSCGSNQGRSNVVKNINNNFILELSTSWKFLKFINKFLHFLGHTHTQTNKKYLFRTSIHQVFSIGTCQFWSKNVEVWVIRARTNVVYKFNEIFQTNKFFTTTIEWTTEVSGWNIEKMSLKNKQKK